MLDVIDRTGQSRLPAFNEVAAERLREAAALLAHQGDNPYRVGAYRRAADAVAAQTADLRELLDRHFTALFSNTARAHELRKVQDWVVIYFHSDSGGEAQRTIVTETRGPLAGQRVVRGREREWLAVYESAPTG